MEEKIYFINEDAVFEHNVYFPDKYVCHESEFEKGPRLSKKRVVVAKSDTSIYDVYVQTHTNLHVPIGHVFDHGSMPEELWVHHSDRRLPIEEGSPLYKALQKYFQIHEALAEEICKASDYSEESYE